MTASPAGLGLCEQCGTPLVSGAVFCGSCGAPAIHSAQPYPEAPVATSREGLQPATPGRRFAAILVDGGLASLILLVVILLATQLMGGGSDEYGTAAGAFMGGYAVGVGAWLIYGIVLWVSNATKGRTPGKAIAGLRLVRESDGGPPGYGPTLMRFLMYDVGALACYIPMIVGIIGICSPDKRHRAWWDTSSGLVMVLDSGSPTPARQPTPTPSAAVPPPPAPLPTTGVPGAPVPLPPPPGPDAVGVGAAAPSPGAAAGGVPLPPPPGGSMITHVPGVQLPDPPADQVAPAPAIPAVPMAQHIETFAGVEDEATHFSPKGRVAPVMFAFDTGERVAVEGSGLVGRNPTPEAGRRYDHLVPIKDPEMSVSKNHFEFGIEGAGVWIMDRGSTNGTTVTAPDGTVLTARPGMRIAVGSGFGVQFGSRTMEVLSVPGQGAQ